MKIAHIINSLSRGGAEVLLKNTIRLFPESEHLIIYLNSPNDMKNEFNGKVSFVCLGHVSWKEVVFSVRKLKKILNEWKPDIIHSHLFDSTLLARLSSKSIAPLVSTIHSTYSTDAFSKSKKALWLEKLTANRQQGLISVSEFVLNDYLKFVPFKGKTFVLYNFLPQRYFGVGKISGKGTIRQLKCVAVGNLKEAKNYGFLLQAFSYLKELNISLDIYGEGSMKNEMQAYVQSNNLKVSLCGSAENIEEILPSYDLFLQASQHEGFGISVAEAMALKLPVAVSDIPVFREITNEHAWFFSLDNVKVLVSILKNMYENMLDRNLHVESAYEQIQKISSENSYKEKLQEIYSSLIHQKA